MDDNISQPGIDIPSVHSPDHQTRKKILHTISGLGFNLNNIIGAGIFIIPSSVWRLTQSPGSALILWIVGGLISLFGSMIYVELGTRFSDGSGEQRYLEETFGDLTNFGHIFSFIIITGILPGMILADAYACSESILYAIKGYDVIESQDLSENFFMLRLTTVGILLIITSYHAFSNQLAININKIIALIKFLALSVISIIGLIKYRGMDMFNNTPSEDSYQRSIVEQIGGYGNAILKQKNLKISNILSVLISTILYCLTVFAFEMVVDPKDAINSNEIISIHFGRTLLGEPGKILILILIAFSSFGCVGSLVFVESRVITYLAKTGFTPKIFKFFYNWHKKFETPFNA
ncbi:8540_t:CDS:2, partial [Scutellospora calospora]